MQPGSVYGQVLLDTFFVILLTVSKSLPFVINLNPSFYHRLAEVNSKSIFIGLPLYLYKCRRSKK